MKSGWKLILSAFAWIVVATGCTFENWDYTWAAHRVGEGYDGSLEFTLLEPDGSMEARSGHASAVFQGALWVFGGFNPNARGDRSSYLADVWCSRDGRAWRNVTMDAPWKGRRGHQVVVFDGALYLIGGYRVYVKDGVSYGGAANDVWRSADGTNWEEIKPNSYRTRATHPSLPADEDVRGANLYDPADDLDWYPRMNHAVAVCDPDGEGPGRQAMVLFGGYAKEWMPYLNDGNLDETRKYFADVWTSEDGARWVQREPMTLGGDDALLFGKYRAGRAEAAHFVHGEELYVMGGTSWFTFQENSQGFVVPGWDRIWKRSSSGWSAIGPNEAEYIERRGHSIVAYDGSYWILPGSKPAAVQWYKGADSIWKFAVDDADGGIAGIARDGSPGTGSPMYGIAEYSAEVFTPGIGVDAGKTAIYVLFGDGDGGVRNTLWKIAKKAGGAS
jgi:hypothetical protein